MGIEAVLGVMCYARCTVTCTDKMGSKEVRQAEVEHAWPPNM